MLTNGKTSDEGSGIPVRLRIEIRVAEPTTNDKNPTMFNPSMISGAHPRSRSGIYEGLVESAQPICHTAIVRRHLRSVCLSDVVNFIP